jgi:alkylation response protein AidB-like acyl-CoA dehydrogenase
VVMLQLCITSNKKKGDKYIINGSKTFLTNGVYGDYYVVAKNKSRTKDKHILVDSNLKEFLP